MSEQRSEIVASQMMQWYGAGALAVSEDRARQARGEGEIVAHAFWTRVGGLINELRSARTQRAAETKATPSMM